MFEFQEKRKLKRLLYSKGSLLILLVLIVLLMPQVWDIYQKERQTRETKEEREAELRELEIRAKAFKTELERLESPRGVEAELRQKFDVVKPGEEVIVLIDDEGGSEDQERKQEGFWERLWNKVF